MRDRYGRELRLRRHLVDSFTSVSEGFGFEPLAVSLLEQAAAYSEEVVGASPWPEWDRKSCFFIPIDDFDANYSEAPKNRQAVLIPEGTVSVTRWLGGRLTMDDKDEVSTFRTKIYYDSQCFRNEPLSSLWEGKGRSFSQFGVEILGADDAASDLEPLALAIEALRSVGVPSDAVVVRLSSNRIFMQLAEEAGLDAQARVKAKEALDTIAECKAGKKPERYDTAYSDLLATLVEANADSGLVDVWKYLARRPEGPLTDEDYNVLSSVNAEDLRYLDSLSAALRDAGIRIEVDLCVVRSHEYYTGFTFEIDIVGKNAERYVEVGGGGRYDRLLADFAPEGFPEAIPSTGFAFGVERLQTALDSAGFVGRDSVRHETFIDLSEDGGVRVEVLPDGDPYETSRKYLHTVSDLADRRRSERISVVSGANR